MKSRLFAGAAVLALMSGAAAAQDLKFPIGEGAFNWDSYKAFDEAYNLDGQSISIFGPWRGEDQVLVESMLAYFSAASGVAVNYSSSEGYEQQIVIDAQAGSPPDVAVLPQPGLIADLAGKGLILPLGDETAGWLADNYGAGPSWAALGTYAGADGTPALYAFPYKADVKSLVWYSPDNFADAGYAVPATMEELLALTDQIVADGGTPWCIGLGSGGATGWPATDWIEDIMLRTQSPETYDKWVTNELPFNSPEVVAAIDIFGGFAKTDANVAGGAAAVASTDFRDSPKGLFTSPPQCYMHHQASFIPSFFPEGTELGTDADFFYFPAFAEKDLGSPVLGAGTLAFVMKESEGARAFIEFLKTPIAHEVWMAQTGFVTPHKAVNVELYGSAALKKQGEILANATTFRFDASDLMPGAVGAGTFWTGMVDFVGGKSAQEVADAIQASWPK
ncbi:MAG: ABC transporter substrate-binding protein [Paracoccaceae bacterium]